MKEITAMTVCELSQRLESRELSALEAVQAYLSRMEEREGEIGAYLHTTAELAMRQAEALDEKRRKGESLSPLAGIPAGIKDNICTQGVPTTCASKMLENYIPPYSATVMEHLSDTVLLGKLNMDEFAMGSTTEHSAFHPTRNPRNPKRVPGGSSGGSAAAVAAGEAAFALGSDTGGSIRQPAAFCGVVGLKPTYGTVSRYGLVAFASSLDQIGPLTKDVRDSALVAQAIMCHDRRDATSLRREAPDLLSHIEAGVSGMTFALPKEYFGPGLNGEIRQAVHDAAKRLEGLGANVVEVSMPSLDYALPAYYVISSAEASSNLARFDGVKYGWRAESPDSLEDLYRRTRSQGFGREVKRRILLGTFALSSGYYDAYYNRALQVRTLVARDFESIFASCDAILSPVAPTVAYSLGEKAQNPMEMYLGDVYTVPVNIAGLPALSIPCGIDGEGMPIGLQLIGPAFSEPTLYRAAFCLEQTIGKEVTL